MPEVFLNEWHQLIRRKDSEKTMKNRLAVAGLCFTLTAGMLTGCSGNSGKAIITLDGQKTEYAVANIMLRYSQAQMQAFYGSYLGDNLWSQYGDSNKEHDDGYPQTDADPRTASGRV